MYIINYTSTGEIIKDYKSPFFIPPTYEFAYLKHYNTKTIEEFIKKVKRGWVDIIQKLDNNLKNIIFKKENNETFE